jgi:hypothetical protein
MPNPRAMGGFAAAAIVNAVLFAHAQTTLVKAVPADAVTAILDAFKSYDVVALGEGPHGNEEGHAFRLSLIRDPRFTAVVNDIMVEFGTSRYQSVIDRFLNGDAVPDADLRRVWRDTTVASPALERPIYEGFYRAVRALNGALPPSRRVRVWLGDAPIEWETITSPLQLRRWGMQKDAHSAGVVKREVLAKGRRALVIYGDGHLQGRGFPERSLTNVLESQPAAARVLTISSSFVDLRKFQPDVSSWRPPVVAKIRGTVIGTQPYARFYPLPPKPGWSTVRLQDQFDAVLWLGDKATVTPLPASLCRDADYMKMRLARMAFDAPQARRSRIDALRQFCAAQK